MTEDCSRPGGYLDRAALVHAAPLLLLVRGNWLPCVLSGGNGWAAPGVARTGDENVAEFAVYVEPVDYFDY